MTLHVKIAGVWTSVDFAHVKYAGVWRKPKKAYVKRSGVWTEAYTYDVVPPSAPVLTVDGVIDHLKVGVRLPEATHNTDLALIRVLHSREAFPSTPLASGYIRTADRSYPYESWSDYYYNGYAVGTSRDHDASQTTVYKEYPVNAGSDTKVAKGAHYFSAWAQDLAGNWSARTNLKHTVDDDFSTPLISRAATFIANDSGTWTNVGSTFVQGDLKQRGNPATFGVWYHGTEFTRNIGALGTANVRKAQIYAYRPPTDQGDQEACVYVFRHNKADSDDGKPTITGSTLVGKLAKGMGKWFELPDSHLEALENDNVSGFGLDFRSPNRAEGMAEDFSTITGVASATGDPSEANLKSGSVYIVWTENP